MANLTALGGARKRPAFSMNGRGIASYMSAGAHRARGIIEEYAFPDEHEAKILIPPLAKDLIYKYYRGGQDEAILIASAAVNAHPALGETKYAKTRRLAALNAAKHLQSFGPKYEFTDVRRRQFQSTINGLTVKPSYDFIAKVKVGKEVKTVCVIFNVSNDISNSDTKLAHHAKIESEVAYDIIINHIPIDEVWYIDLSSEKIVRKLKKPLVSVKRDIEATCDDIMLRYHNLVAKRSQGTA